MGTAEFAVPSLDRLIQDGHSVKAVITAPDKPSGRGQQVSGSPVKEFAVGKGIALLQPENLKSEVFLEELRTIPHDLQVVVAFRILPDMVFEIPKYGAINLHASLLPDYRGAAPINRVIMNGEKETGVNTFIIQKGVDTGMILDKESTRIGENETAGELHDRLMLTGAELMSRTVRAFTDESYKAIPQEDSGNLHSAPKIFNKDCKIDWNLPAKSIHDFIRGLSPYPGAWTILDDKVLKIYLAGYEIADHNEPHGTLLSDEKTYLKSAVDGGFVKLFEVKVEGKKRLKITDFLAGSRIKKFAV
ncbi:MAG: methionyl-tRNA formyltransferase [Bacteroidetes bacterium]|nr:methionyl-tRNA formyltransferase [Bacteroidota bacterium]